MQLAVDDVAGETVPGVIVTALQATVGVPPLVETKLKLTVPVGKLWTLPAGVGMGLT